MVRPSRRSIGSVSLVLVLGINTAVGVEKGSLVSARVATKIVQLFPVPLSRAK